MSIAYSSTPLFKKLGLKDGMNTKFINPPKGYINQFKKDVDIIGSEAPFDFIQLFTNSSGEYFNELPLLKKQLKKNGIFWVSWYKKASGKKTELTEDMIRNYALETGLVDVKICSVDEDWSGLKLVFRLKDR
jgi:cell division protein FtsI/penicillin-binding protein 2